LHVAIWLVGLQWTSWGLIQLYHQWVYNGPAEVISSYIISGSTADWPSLHVAIWLVGLQWSGQGCIQLYALWVVNGPADSLSSHRIRESIIVTSGPNIWLVNRRCTSQRTKPLARAHQFVQSIHHHLTTSLPTRSLHPTEINIPHTAATHCFSPSSLVLGIINATQFFHTSLWNGVDRASLFPIGQEVLRSLYYRMIPHSSCHPNPTSCGLWTSSEDTCCSQCKSTGLP